MEKIMKISIVFLMLLVLAGCVGVKSDDGTTKWKLAPEVLEKAEEVGETALGLLGVLAPLLGPAGGLAIGGLATGLTILKRAKPKLKDAQTKGELFNTVASISVDALEVIKKDHPAVWKKLSDKLQKEVEDSGLDTKAVKNAIRGLRGLPPKP